jgi:hypothetical protein
MLKWNRLTRQYLVCTPRASVTALILLCMELIRAFILLMGILSHSSNKATLNWSRVAGEFRRSLTLLSISSHRCSIGDKSGLYGGQSSGLILWLARKSWQTLATRCRRYPAGKLSDAVSQMELQPTGGFHPYFLRLLHYRLSQWSDFNPWDIPPQTITEPPPNLSLSRMQASAKRSPRGRHTWRRPSGRKRVNCDSSVKKTRLHCLIGNCLGPCATNQAIWHVRHARVRGKPM